MLGLKLPTDPRWVDIASKNLEEILTDHAFCEQKAASAAISFIVTYPELSDLVVEMSALAIEEMQHFQQVHQIALRRGIVLGRDRKDMYVARIRSFFAKTSDRKERLVHRLLIAALIEARSCERFKLLSERIDDAELASFYAELFESEAAHYSLFLGFARKYGKREEVDLLWNELLSFEAGIMSELGKEEKIHG